MMNTESPAVRNPQAGLAIYATICASIVALLLLTNWPAYHFAIRGGPIPLYYFALPGLFIVPILFAEPATGVRFFREPLFWWFVVYMVLGLLWLLLSQDFIEEASRQWRQRVLALYFFFTIAILVSDANRRLLALVIVGCLLIATAANWFDLMRPYRFVPEGIEGSNAGRGAGFYMNANAAASFVVMGTLAALPFVPMRFRGLLLIGAVVGVAPTLSRSGFIFVIVAIAGSIMMKLLNRVQTILVLVALPVLLAATVVYYDRLIVSSDSSNLEKTVDRLRWFEGEEDASSEERRWVAAHARDMFIEQPLFGHGIGATTLDRLGAGPHNMYVALMAEQGVFGLALYVSLIVIMFRQGRRIARTALTAEGQDIGRALAVYALFLAAYGMFSHNVLEEAHGMFAIAFLTAAGLRVGTGTGSVAQQAMKPLPARARWRVSGAQVARLDQRIGGAGGKTTPSA
jgi:O-antigen ligase